MHSMFHQQLRRYFTYLGLVLAAMGVYRVVVVPAIEPLEHPVPRSSVAFEPIDQKPWWESMFPSGAWQNSSPIVLFTQQGTLLFKQWQPLGTNSYQLAPLTMIVPLSKLPVGERSANPSTQILGKQAGENLVVIDAPEGAVIQFQEALDLTNGKTPPIVGGRLVGPIRIRNLPGAGQTSEPWELTTRDVRIERRKVWTIEAVELRFRNGVMRGRDLSIYLKQDLLGASDSDDSPWGLLDHMELIYVEKVEVGLPPGGLWASLPLGNAPPKSTLANLPARIELQCAGRLRFDFNRSEASLKDRVHIIHTLGQLPPDQVWCDYLEIGAELEKAQVNVANRKTLRLGPLVVKTLEALGTDAVGPQPVEPLVRVEAPNIGAELRCKRVFADTQQNQIDLAGQLNPRATPSIVNLRYSGHEFFSPLIQYRAAANSEHPGWLYAQGPGEVRTSEESEFGHWQARWNESLRMKPDGAMQWVSLSGQSFVESAKHGYLAGDTIELWLVSNQKSVVVDSPATNPRDAYAVDHVHAQGAVTLGTKTQKTRVDDLHLALVYPQVEVAPSSQVQPPQLQLNGFTGPPKAAPVFQPQMAASPLADNRASEPAARQIPISVHGKVLRSRIIFVNGQSWIDDLTIDGPLTIFRESEIPLGQPTWRIEGSQLRTETNAAGQADLQIVGEPAMIALGEGWLKGPIIRLDQKTGLVWMDQPGSFSVPTDLMQSRSPDSTAKWLKPLTCIWQGRMLFDGSMARVEGGVLLDGIVQTAPERVWLLEGTCEALEIKLSHPIDLRKPQIAESTLQDVTLKGHVDIRASQTDLQQNRISRERIVVPKLTYQVAQNRLLGDGPGWIRSRHFSQARPGKLASTGPATGAQALQGVHLKFRDVMEAALARNEISFLGKVEVGLGPIQSFDDDLDLDKMRSLSPGQTLLSGDLMQAYDLSPLSTTTAKLASASNAWEFKTSGHVVFESKSEGGNASGNAHEVTYTQHKDLLVLKSDGRTPARLKRNPIAPSRVGNFEILVHSASIDTRTMEPIDSELAEISVDLTPQTQTPNKAPQIPLAPISRPRNGVSEWLQGKP